MVLKPLNILEARKKNSQIPIIFVTEINKELEYIQEGYNNGAVDYLFKPIDPTIVNGKIRVFKDLFISKQLLKEKIRN